MLRDMGWTEAADLIIKGISGAIAAKTVTYDFERLMPGATLLRCSEFGEAIIANMDTWNCEAIYELKPVVIAGFL